MSFAIGSFNWVVSSLVLHYIEDWDETFREFRRILKPGGYVLFPIGHPFMDLAYFQRADYFRRAVNSPSQRDLRIWSW